MTADVVVEKDKAILRVTLNRPEKHNALSRSMLDSLGEIFIEHATDQALKVAVLTGAGKHSFAAGGDLTDLSTLRTLAEAREMARQAKSALNAVRAFPVPVVVALNGNAMGGGAELATAGDFRVAAAHANIGFIQGRLNITTAWGGGVDLMRLVGPDRALRLMCSAEMLSPAQALKIGLYDTVIPAGDLDDVVGNETQSLEMAVDEFVQPFLRQAPQVLRSFKALVVARRRGECLADLYELETDQFASNWIHPDHWRAADRIMEKSSSKG